MVTHSKGFNSMSIEAQSQHPLRWFLSGVGAQLYAREREQFATVHHSYRHATVLQLGAPPMIQSFSHCHYLHYDTDLYFPSIGYNVCGDFDRLAVRSEIMDIVVIPHLHEYIADFPSVIPEIYRVLVPEGRVVIFGFNPWSLWGVQRVLGQRNIVPWCKTFYNANMVIKRFEDQDFVLLEQHRLFPAVRSECCQVLEQLGCHVLGVVYMLVLGKRSATMTLNTERSHFVKPSENLI